MRGTMKRSNRRAVPKTFPSGVPRVCYTLGGISAGTDSVISSVLGLFFGYVVSPVRTGRRHFTVASRENGNHADHLHRGRPKILDLVRLVRPAINGVTRLKLGFIAVRVHVRRFALEKIEFVVFHVFVE